MNADAAHLQAVEALFHQIAELPADQRDSVLQRCDPRLAAEVLSLLQADDAVAGAAAASALAGSTRLLDRPVPDTDSEDQLAGTVAGRYRLRHIVGRGGMGVVYLAERMGDEARLESRVAQTERDAGAPPIVRAAVKILRGGHASGTAVTTFLHERDALARFAHAGIARLLDAGITADGRPYVAMEYVDGERIDRFAERPGITAQQLLPVLEQLCKAVIEAHRNLILHRDIKSSNILVTAEHRAKLLDFGTRQLLDESGAVSSGEAAGGLTMRYASPEQLQAQPLSTASDVYSLGLTMYRVLHGALPPLLEGNSVGSYLEQLRAGSVPEPIGSNERARLGISRAQASDLNSIVLTAIRHAPKDRYSSVSALLQDLRAALAGKRVRARGDGLLYTALLLLRTRRAELAVALLSVLLLLSGLLLSLQQKHRAGVLAQRTQAGVQAEQQLAHFLLFDYFDQLHDQPGSIPAQRVAATEALRSLDELGQHSTDAAPRIDAIEGYTRLGKLLGSPYEQDLGDVPAATAALHHAIELAERLRSSGGDTPAVREAEEAARTGAAQVLIGNGDYTHALALMLPAAQTARSVAAGSGSSAASLLRSAITLNTFGDIYGQESYMALHDGPRSIAVYTEAQAAYAAAIVRDPACNICRSGMAVESWKLGMLHRDTDTVVAAELYRQALQSIESLPAAELNKSLNRRRHIFIRQRLAEAEQNLGNLAVALQLDEAAQADCRQVVAQSPQDIQSRRDLADIASQITDMYLQAGKPQQAVTTAREYVEEEEAIARLSPKSSMWQQLRFDSEDVLSRALKADGNPAEAAAMRTRALSDILHFADDPSATDSVLSTAAAILTRAQAFPEKAALYAERDMKDDQDPDGAELLELARAESDVHNAAKANAALKAAFSFFARYPRAPDHDASVRQLKALQALNQNR